MKKLLVLFAFFLSSEIFAQEGFHLGIIAGPQLTSQLNQQDFDNADVRYDGLPVRGAFGITANYHFTDKLGLGTQFLLSYHSFRYRNRIGIQYLRKTNYFKIPILFHVNSTADKFVGGYFYIGPQISVQFAKDFKINEQTYSNVSPTVHASYLTVNKWYTIGGVMGFGIVFNILKGRLQANLGLRLDGDFTDAYKGKDLTGLPIGNTGKFTDFDSSTGLFATDPNTGNRSPTHNVAAMMEIGFKFVFMKKKV